MKLVLKKNNDDIIFMFIFIEKLSAPFGEILSQI